ncbi:MAG: GNAT family N-acetyltransferase [Saprospiraceae bacterium]|nr:GNAT family N-acetyltransferase [Saprospiraceae bacterium]
MPSFQLTPYAELSLNQLYEILRLRAEVFVVEQDCPYQDLDELDQQAYHLKTWSPKGELQAYARILPPGASYEGYASIGRVVTSPGVRGKGFGKKLMEEAIESCKFLFPEKPIKISAQVYLLEFYRSLGFESDGAGYLEDGIPHIGMIRP